MLVLAAKQVATPFPSRSWLDDPALRLTSDKGVRAAGTWIRGIVLHTTEGRWPQPILAGAGKAGAALANISYWNRSASAASSHLLVDRDGAVVQCADLISEVTWHATSVNNVTVGIEICQGTDGSLYQCQIDATVKLCDWLTAALGIQRQVPRAYAGHPVKRLSDGGKDVVGVYGHRDQTSNKGRGDPGDAVMETLMGVGYEQYDLSQSADIAEWTARQKALGIPADGIPGKATVAALKAAGYPDGMWVRRC